MPSISRALVVQMDRAVALLEEAGTPSELAIHTTRKAIKRSRGLLRLLRDLPGSDAYRVENLTLRDLGRQLADLRDAAVVVDTLDRYGTDIEAAVGTRVLGGIRSCVGAALESQDDVTTIRLDVSRALGTARARYTTLFDDAADEEFAALAAGLRRAYRGGRNVMRVAAASGRVGEFHEWRKRVKYLRYQLEHLCLLEPELIAGGIAQLLRIDQLLGDAHDLWLLAGSIEDRCPVNGQRAVVMAVLDTKRRHLEQNALEVGAPFYADGPGAFASELAAYWRAATSN